MCGKDIIFMIQVLLILKWVRQIWSNDTATSTIWRFHYNKLVWTYILSLAGRFTYLWEILRIYIYIYKMNFVSPPGHVLFSLYKPYFNIIKKNSGSEALVWKLFSVWENSKFPLQFLVLPNFHACSITVWKHGKCSLFLKWKQENVKRFIRVIPTKIDPTSIEVRSIQLRYRCQFAFERSHSCRSAFDLYCRSTKVSINSHYLIYRGDSASHKLTILC